jgi:DTW domain-containing protein YfiP
MCYRCFWPRALCWCPSLHPIETRTRFAFLMHPKEFKEEKAGTGRLTQLCLPSSSLHVGVGFDGDARVQELLSDPALLPVLLYPGRQALNLSRAGDPGDPQSGALRLLVREARRRTLLVLLLDATWSGARKMLRLSPGLQVLPRVMFTPESPSRYVIKQQPQAGCLSTLESVHELLQVLERLGLDRYPNPGQLLGIFGRMQDFQVRCAADPARPGYRRKPFSEPIDRARPGGRSRRDNYLRTPVTAAL